MMVLMWDVCVVCCCCVFAVSCGVGVVVLRFALC